MKIGISTKVLKQFPLEKTVKHLADAGYEIIEIWIEQIWRDVKDLNRFKGVIKELPAEFTLHGPTEDLNISSTNKSIRDVSVDEYCKSIETAVELEIGSITIHPGRVTSMKDKPEETWKLMMEGLARIIRKAETDHVDLNLENMEKRAKETVISPEHLNKILKTFNSDYLGVTLDTAHAATTGEYSPDDFLERVSPIRNIHVSDSDSGIIHLPLGWGSEPLKDVFTSLKNHNCTGFVIEGLVPGREEEAVRQNIIYWDRLKELI